MKIRVNTKKILTLNPCKDRLDNWNNYYSDFNKDIVKFLRLENITHNDKIWVAVRLMPRNLLKIFEIDCIFAAEKYAAYVYYDYYAAVYAAHDVIAAANAANAATGHAAAAGHAATAAERNNQIEALIYLIESEDL